jgi:hypothetical protein
MLSRGPLPRSSRVGTPARALVAFVFVAGCGGAPPAVAEPSPTPEVAHAEAEPPASPVAEAPPPIAEPARAEPAAKDDSVPDVYELTNGDCATLSRQLGDLTRSDERAKLSPKLTEKQRAAVDKSIDDAAAKIADGWVSMCQSTLVGKVVDPKALACALDAKSVHAFDVCLNGSAAPASAK